MKYVNAGNILPDALVRELQKYIQGGYIYVPRNQARRAWGEATGYRQELKCRNQKIVEEYRSGVSAEAATVEKSAIEERAAIALLKTASSLSSKDRITNFPNESPPYI